jgi:hypothetical protein
MSGNLPVRIWEILFLLSLLSGLVHAQELDPRAYQPAPVDVNGFTLGYTRSFGDIVFEPSVPIEDAQAHLNFGAAAYYHTFGLFGRFANALIALPYASGHLSGTVEERRGEIYRSGLADLHLRFAINLKGTPAMKLPEFIKHKNKANLGASLLISVPTGQYDPAKIVNIGQNRWAFKPEIGLTKFMGRWQMDAYGGVWFFTANKNFRGKTRTQDPIASFQFHLTYNLRPAFWFGVDANFYSGGLIETDGVPGTIKQNNSRIGGTLSLPIARAQSLKFSASRGIIVSRGGDFTSLGVAYNYAWASK